MTGTVFDIGYRSYAGAREGRRRGWLAVYKDGIRAALGLGRGPRAKVLPWLFIGVLTAIALVMAIIAGAAERMMGPGATERLDLPTHSDYYGIASIIVFVFAAIVGPELLCRDRREGTIQLYLVHPITSTDYLGARWAAMFSVLLAAAWLPQAILFLGLCGGDPSPATYFLAHWLDIPRFLLAGVVVVAYTVTIAMLTASFTTRRAYASVFLVGLFAITAPFTIGLAQELDGPVAQWISMFSLTDIPLHVNDAIFGKVSEMTEHAPARALGTAVLVGWYLAWTLIPATLLWSRYRRLAA